MVVPIVCFSLGVIGLWWSGDYVIKYSLDVAHLFKVTSLFVGVLILSVSTGFPELAVAFQSIWMGIPALSVGDIIGSNFVNVALILGIPVFFIRPVVFKKKEVPHYLFLLLITLAIMLAVSFIRILDWWHGALLVGIYLVSMAWFWVNRKETAKKSKRLESLAEEHYENGPEKVIALLKLLASLVALLLAAKIAVYGALGLARVFQINIERFGAVAVALGTSLPELSVNFFAIKNKQYELAIGNALGSSFEQGALVLGLLLLGAQTSIDVTPILSIFPFMTVTFLLVAWRLLTNRRLSKWDGLAMILLWLGFVLW